MKAAKILSMMDTAPHVWASDYQSVNPHCAAYMIAQVQFVAGELTVLRKGQISELIVFTHEGLFGEQSRRARRLWLIGLGSIFLSFILSFSYGLHPVFIYLAYPFLLVGLPLWTMGRTAQRRLKSAPRADRQINAELKGLNSKYSLHHYPRVAGKLLDHVLVTPDGVVLMVANESIGPVLCKHGSNGDRWSAPTSIIDRITGQKPPIGNPSRRAAEVEEMGRDMLSTFGKPGVPVKSLIVFTMNPEIELRECTYSAVPLSELKRAVREQQELMAEAREGSSDLGLMLTSEERRKLNNLLSPQAAPTAPNTSPAQKVSR